MRRLGQGNQGPRSGAAAATTGAERSKGGRAGLVAPALTAIMAVVAIAALGGPWAAGCDSPGTTTPLPDAVADGQPTDGADTAGGGDLDGGTPDAPLGDAETTDAPARPDGELFDESGQDQSGQDQDQLAPDLPIGDPGAADETAADLPTPDTGGLGCTAESCPEGFGCVSKVCVARCPDGAALEDLVAALGPGITPVSQVCADTSAIYAWDVLSSWEVLEVKATDLSASSTSLALRKWPLFGQSGPAGAAILSASTVPGSVALWEVFPSPMLAVDEEGGTALWGYTATGSGTTGAVFATPIQGGTTSTFPAVAPMGGALRQGAALVSAQDVSGAGVGPGLYLLNLAGGLSTRVVLDLGSAPGHVASWNGQILLGGYAEQWPDCGQGGAPTPGDRVFEATEDGIMTAYGAGTPVSASCELPSLGLSADVRFLRDGRILERQSANGWDTDALVMHTWTRDASGAVLLGTSRVLSAGPLYRGARGVGDAGLIVLQHEAGYLVVQGPGPMPDPGPVSQPDTVEAVEEATADADAGSADATGEVLDDVDEGSAEAGPVPQR